ncbi:hypothetical protein [Alteromonas stellipolaris]|uniref:hypothetical protein n=1 Tax=Alteromonas stellipolaris TaxID=233316 RepID=UPI001D910B1F|nr:hypothetical protein [Alteromonas stellipolaris]MBZ2163199.1 hypothetical protein [Alteromonas stellipolaris]
MSKLTKHLEPVSQPLLPSRANITLVLHEPRSDLGLTFSMASLPFIMKEMPQVKGTVIPNIGYVLNDGLTQFERIEALLVEDLGIAHNVTHIEKIALNGEQTAFVVTFNINVALPARTAKLAA